MLPRTVSDQDRVCFVCRLPDCDQGDPRCPFCATDPVTAVIRQFERALYDQVRRAARQIMMEVGRG